MPLSHLIALISNAHPRSKTRQARHRSTRHGWTLLRKTRSRD